MFHCQQLLFYRYQQVKSNASPSFIQCDSISNDCIWVNFNSAAHSVSLWHGYENVGFLHFTICSLIHDVYLYLIEINAFPINSIIRTNPKLFPWINVYYWDSLQKFLIKIDFKHFSWKHFEITNSMDQISKLFCNPNGYTDC